MLRKNEKYTKNNGRINLMRRVTSEVRGVEILVV
jgi:hypothetical protein